MIDGGQIEDAVRAQLRTWFYTELVKVERATGRTPGKLLLPRTWLVVNQPRAPLGPDQLPAIRITAPGVDGTPELDADGTYRAAWTIEVAAIVSTTDHAATLRHARLYALAIRAVLTRYPGIAPWAMGVEWVGESYNAGPGGLERTEAHGTVTFRVYADDVLDVTDVSAVPLPDPVDGEEPPEDPAATPLTEENIDVAVTHTDDD